MSIDCMPFTETPDSSSITTTVGVKYPISKRKTMPEIQPHKKLKENYPGTSNIFPYVDKLSKQT
jgi:hypothetical protein